MSTPAEFATRTPNRELLRQAGTRVASTIASAVAALALVLVAWTAFVQLVGVSDFIAKTPLDVWRYVVSGPDAPAQRAELLSRLGVTLGDAALGYVAGLGLAAAVTLLFYFSRLLERMFIPSVTALSAIPMVVVAPILVLVFGRGLTSAALIGAAVVFVPALLMMLDGIARTPRSLVDMCDAYGGSTFDRFRKFALPHALPHWFAAARIAVTQAMIGALLAEWLSTGAGLGGQMLLDANQFQFDRLWSGVALLTFTSICLYQLASVVESLVAARMAGRL
ncbi:MULTISPECIES: ABC transporter permease [Pseudonocardia]|uniref:ABC transporter permease n=2 Tax=Pseudonocardia TaxID=1847 RepID=A0ABQ0S1A7_9PSEU|nr:MULTISPECIES: ABC transporter permease subunit [Pseudonocardia]OSY38502.1 putative aliphatic sulfonates transport permease protein SsuC [Pseudonocardia autotrophica]TDN77055.1 ABC-type nitrate/sulfonate/bicarbonate transport system permease component [Pseudonocardia autotrophica]BBG01061.1 ABC transporter permease [Pseudonocardia autotrophica]GEC26689.1 ABC transporter permease [Pseudonocardia saturnea]